MLRFSSYYLDQDGSIINYLHAITSFTNDVFNKAMNLFEDEINSFLLMKEWSPKRYKSECVAELLEFSILWQNFLLKDKKHVANNYALFCDSSEIDSFLYELKLTNDFNQEIAKFFDWNSFALTFDKSHLNNFIENFLKFGSWFRVESEKKLNQFTFELDDSLIGDSPFGKKINYYTNMVCAELLNRAYKDEFAGTKNRVVVVPRCLCNPHDSYCKSEKHEFDSTCKECNPHCIVKKIKSECDNRNIKVFIVPHSSSVDGFLTNHNINQSVGLVGVACVPNLMKGGWQVRSRDVPVQCVPLSFYGCKDNWPNGELPTSVDIQELLSICDYPCISIRP